jgi:transcriptional regulator with XRE-family HTH domain
MKANICGQRVRELRESRAWDQVELAAALAVDYGLKLEQSDISEIERGVRGVRDFELKAISLVFGVSADWLLGETTPNG